MPEIDWRREKKGMGATLSGDEVESDENDGRDETEGS